MKQTTIFDWKNKYGKIYKIKLEGQDVYFRALTINEITNLTDKNNMEKVIPNLIILNKVDLKLPGSYIVLSKYAHEYSVGSNDDDVEEMAILARKKVDSDFALSLIANICIVYPYTPDDLKKKTLSQLIDIVALAEFARGDKLIGKTDKHELTPPEMINNNGKFSPPNVDKLMSDSTNALSDAMTKEGKKVDVFKRTEKDGSELSSFHKQMKELNGI